MIRKSHALLFAFTIAGYSLVSAIPSLTGVDSRVVSIPFRAISLGLALLVGMVLGVRHRLYRGAAWFPLLTFWVLYVIRMAVDTVFDPIPVKLTGLEYAAWGLGTCFIPLIAFLSDPGDEVLLLAEKYSFYACAGALAGALVANYIELSQGISDTYASGRLGTDTLNPISLGHLAVSVVLISGCYLPS